MAINDGVPGTLFSDILDDKETVEAERLAAAFSNKSPRIVSPTVSGFLNSFNDRSEFSSTFKLDGCDIDYYDDKELEKYDTTPRTEDSALQSLEELTKSTGDFIKKVSEIRSSYLSINEIKQSNMESFENAFMRMLGMPSEADLDGSEKIIYISPSAVNLDKLTRMITTVNGLLGNVTSIDPQSDRFQDILLQRKIPVDAERTKNPADSRHFDFNNVCVTDDALTKTLNDIAKGAVEAQKDKDKNVASGVNPEDAIISYNNPNQLFRFYYLKSVPLQDSSIYNCIIEPEKIVLKPFDKNSSVPINGIKPKTSLLETIIRIRLDRISGKPSIYSSESTDASSGLSKEAVNVDRDQITEVECFLIQKLKRTLYLLAEKYIHDTTQFSFNVVKNILETGNYLEGSSKDTESSTDKNKDKPLGSSTETVAKKESEIVDYGNDIPRLEILKAREDAILFLLKDTSSSYNVGNSSAVYSSIALQEGTIRATSGFDDVLSGPLYSIFSNKSNYLNKLIKEKKEEIDKKYAKTGDAGQTGSGPDSTGLEKNRGSDLYTYSGVSPEDFIIYMIAMLSISEDYLIGLLPKENRRNLANIISNSVIGGNSRRNDPYGILRRVELPPDQGGYPSVADSVNALGLIVGKLYEEYVSYARGQNNSFYDELLEKSKIVKSSGNKK